MSTIMRAFTVMERLTTPPRDTTTFSSRKEEAKIDKRKERTGRKLRIYERIRVVKCFKRKSKLWMKKEIYARDST